MSQTFANVVSEGSNLHPPFNPSRKSPEKRPTKEQAVILSCTEPDHILKTPFYLFVRAVGSIEGANNINSASRIPGPKFCVFLQTQDLAKKLQDEHPTIQVNYYHFTLSPYTQPAAKLVLCNTWPIIPNSVFEEALDKNLDRQIHFISP